MPQLARSGHQPSNRRINVVLETIAMSFAPKSNPPRQLDCPTHSRCGAGQRGLLISEPSWSV